MYIEPNKWLYNEIRIDRNKISLTRYQFYEYESDQYDAKQGCSRWKGTVIKPASMSLTQTTCLRITGM